MVKDYDWRTPKVGGVPLVQGHHYRVLFQDGGQRDVVLTTWTMDHRGAPIALGLEYDGVAACIPWSSVAILAHLGSEAPAW